MRRTGAWRGLRCVLVVLIAVLLAAAALALPVSVARGKRLLAATLIILTLGLSLGPGIIRVTSSEPLGVVAAVDGAARTSAERGTTTLR